MSCDLSFDRDCYLFWDFDLERIFPKKLLLFYSYLSVFLWEKYLTGFKRVLASEIE